MSDRTIIIILVIWCFAMFFITNSRITNLYTQLAKAKQKSNDDLNELAGKIEAYNSGFMAGSLKKEAPINFPLTAKVVPTPQTAA